MASKQFNSVDGYSVGSTPVSIIDANANITAVALTANGNVSFTGANVSLGAVGNLKITGGSSGLYLQTDGSGNLSWQAVSVSTASISNGNSNVNIPAANGNVVVSVNGVANTATFTSNAVFRGSYGLTGAIFQANTAPASPQPGDQWYNTFNGILFEYLDDGTSSQWVDIGSIPYPNVIIANASAVLNNVQTSGTYYPAFISSTANGNYSLNSNTAFSANIANGALIATTFVGALSGAATTAGTVTTAAQPNITSVGTLSSLTVTGNVAGGNLTTGGAVVATGNVSGSGLIIDGLANITGNAIVGGIVSATGNVSGGNLTTAGALSVTGNANVGNIGATNGVFTNVSGNGSALSSITGANVTGTVATATTAGTVTTNAQPNITSVGTLGNLSVTANITGGNLVTAGKVYASEMIDGGTGIYLAAGPSGYINFFTTGGDKASISDTGNIIASNVIANSTVFATTANISGNVLASGVYATLLDGTLTNASNAQPNITSVGTLTSATVTGNVAAGNLTTTGVLSVTGTGVSSIAGNLDMTSNTIINLATPTNPTDAATKQYVDDIAQGLHTHDSCNAATNTTLATISGGTVTYNNGASGVGANLTTTGSFTTIDGVTLSNGMRILVKNEANSAHNGIYDRTSTTVLTRSDDFNTPTEMAGGDFTFVTAGTLYDNTGWVMVDAVTTVGTSPVDWVQFSGAGTYTAGTGLTLTGTAFSVNASQSQITSVGTLTGLNSSGTITAPAFTANTGVFTGNGSGLSAVAGANVTGAVAFAITANAVAGANVSGTVANATFATSAGSATTAGTVTTAAQPNITSTGTLTSVPTSGNLTFSSTGQRILGDMTNATFTNRVAFQTTTVNGSTNIHAIPNGSGTQSGFKAESDATFANGQFFSMDIVGGSDARFNSSIRGTGSYVPMTFWTSGAEKMRIDTVGNVGIGTNSPVQKLMVTSSSNTTLGIESSGATDLLRGLAVVSGASEYATFKQRLDTGELQITSGVAGWGGLTTFHTNGTEKMRLDINGNLGIGTVAGTHKLSVAGTANVTGTTSLSTSSGYVSVGGTSQFNSFKYNQDSGALGNTVGNQVRHATYYSTSTNADYLEITNTRYANGTDWTTAGTRLQQKIDATWMGFIQFNGAVQGGITFGTGLNSTPNAIPGRTVMDSSGNFYPLTDNSLTLGASGQRWSTAFATTVQTTALTTGANTTAGSITGNWSLTTGSRLTATYADLAEKYVADDTYEPGTVLMFGGEQEVTLATTFDSTKVAGVVTTNPAYSMNAALEAEHVAEIALQGRVPCKVIGPIEKGDLMVSASNGHAIANNEARAGTIIGKALENFTGELGIIEVAVGRF
jgi:hypothetical protein